MRICFDPFAGEVGEGAAWLCVGISYSIDHDCIGRPRLGMLLVDRVEVYDADGRPCDPREPTLWRGIAKWWADRHKADIEILVVDRHEEAYSQKSREKKWDIITPSHATYR